MDGLSIFHWIIVIGVIVLIYKAFHGNGKISGNGTMICPNCGIRGEPQQITKGSTGIELLLWICFIVPGLIYSLWRFSSRYPGCPSCEQVGMIKIDSPNGRLLVKKLGEQA